MGRVGWRSASTRGVAGDGRADISTVRIWGGATARAGHRRRTSGLDIQRSAAGCPSRRLRARGQSCAKASRRRDGRPEAPLASTRHRRWTLPRYQRWAPTPDTSYHPSHRECCPRPDGGRRQPRVAPLIVFTVCVRACRGTVAVGACVRTHTVMCWEGAVTMWPCRQLRGPPCRQQCHWLWSSRDRCAHSPAIPPRPMLLARASASA